MNKKSDLNEDIEFENLNSNSTQRSTIEALRSLRQSNGNLSQIDLAISVLAVFFNANLTQKALEDILKLMNFATGCDLPTNFNQLTRLIMKSMDDEIMYKKIWYCDVCTKVYDKLENRFIRKCPICCSRLSMYFHLSIKHQLQRIFSNQKFTDVQLGNQNVIKDITDGRIYKKVMQEEKLNNNNIYTLSFSTDGVSICEKSNLGIWPIYAVCNEISIDKRFCPENVLILGY